MFFNLFRMGLELEKMWDLDPESEAQSIRARVDQVRASNSNGLSLKGIEVNKEEIDTLLSGDAGLEALIRGFGSKILSKGDERVIDGYIQGLKATVTSLMRLALREGIGLDACDAINLVNDEYQEVINYIGSKIAESKNFKLSNTFLTKCIRGALIYRSASEVIEILESVFQRLPNLASNYSILRIINFGHEDPAGEFISRVELMTNAEEVKRKLKEDTGRDDIPEEIFNDLILRKLLFTTVYPYRVLRDNLDRVLDFDYKRLLSENSFDPKDFEDYSVHFYKYAYANRNAADSFQSILEKAKSEEDSIRYVLIAIGAIKPHTTALSKTVFVVEAQKPAELEVVESTKYNTLDEIMGDSRFDKFRATDEEDVDRDDVELLDLFKSVLNEQGVDWSLVIRPNRIEYDNVVLDQYLTHVLHGLTYTLIGNIYRNNIDPIIMSNRASKLKERINKALAARNN